MQALINMITGFIALLAAMALAQFGVDLNSPRSADRSAEREVHRTADCRNASPGRSLISGDLAAASKPPC